MAEHGAHITTKSPAPLGRPSIFELLCQESLSSGLRNAFHHLVHHVLVDAHPEKYAWLKIWADEVYLVFDSIVQFSHLRVYKASFAEHFYGLRRVDHDGQRISSRQMVLSFTILVFYPYFKKKLDQVFSNIRHEMASSRQSDDALSASVYFTKIYPFVCFLMETSNMILQVTYSLGKSDSYSLWCNFLAIRLMMNAKKEESKHVSNSWSTWYLAKLTAKTIGSGLYVGAFFIQFLEYFYAREGTISNKMMKKPRPDPPTNSLYSRVKINRLKDYCLLCNEKRRNDTVLSTSGFIFCYSCIRAFVARNHKCPATGLPSDLNHLIRLYPPEG